MLIARVLTFVCLAAGCTNTHKMDATAPIHEPRVAKSLTLPSEMDTDLNYIRNLSKSGIIINPENGMQFYLEGRAKAVPTLYISLSGNGSSNSQTFRTVGADVIGSVDTSQLTLSGKEKLAKSSQVIGLIFEQIRRKDPRWHGASYYRLLNLTDEQSGQGYDPGTVGYILNVGGMLSLAVYQHPSVSNILMVTGTFELAYIPRGRQ